MKLRIKGNSLRLRITRPELDQLMNEGRIEETITFASDDRSRLTYSLEHVATSSTPTVRFNPPSLDVLIPTAQAQQWSMGEDVGIYAAIDLGANGSLELIIEKDFACIHGTAEENRDAFANPRLSADAKL
ncbi:MAG TPA: hypothetical protein VGR47_07275 [Terracidiphilus sp.]|nr:hypothetical protein [Terracidiphilus sp.]